MEMITEVAVVQGILLVIIGVLLFEFIILLHEGGHCVAAKLSGVKVNEFALGMGPKLFSFQKGETTYSLRLFPIGGFCAMEGEDGESDDERAFSNKAVWKRMIIVVAGAFMNIILGLLLVMITLLPESAFPSLQVSVFVDGATTSQKLQLGDSITSINGYSTSTWLDMSFALGTAKENDFTMEVDRKGEKVVLDHVVFPTGTDSEGNERVALDFKVEPIENNVGNLIVQTGKQTVSVLRMVWNSLGGLLTGQFGLNDVSGPVGMASATGQAASQALERSFGDSVLTIVNIMAIITLNLGIVNLLPLPALDGGRFVFLLIEAIFRKPVKREVEAWIHAGGMVLLLVFMLVITIKDVIQLIPKGG